MTKKRMDVDMGAMSLTVGEDRVGLPELPSSERLDPLAVERFAGLLGARGGGASRRHPDQPGGLPSPFSLLGAAEPSVADCTDELGSLIERLWFSDGAVGIREVRVTLQRRILPDTSIRLYEADGRLQIALTAGAETTRRWLEAALPALGQDLGRRLNRPLRVTLSGTHEDDRVTLRWDWPEAGQP